MSTLAPNPQSHTRLDRPVTQSREAALPLPDRASLVRGLWTRRWRLVAGALLGGVVAGALSYLVEPRYRATTRFIVQAGGDIQVPAALQGLVAQLGVGGPAAQSPDFYVALTRQPTIALGVMRDSFATGAASRAAVPLLSLLSIDTTGMLTSEVEEEALTAYRARAQARVNSRTGIVEVSFDAPDPRLAADVANSIVARLAKFDIVLRRTSSSNTRVFLDQQVETAEAELRRANEALENFLTANRDFQNSPRLSILYDRRRRETNRLESQYEQLILQRDRARIEEVSSVPALSIVDSASAPFRRASPKRRLWAALGLMFGGAAATVIVVLATIGAESGTTARADVIRGAVLLATRVGRRL